MPRGPDGDDELVEIDVEIADADAAPARAAAATARRRARGNARRVARLVETGESTEPNRERLAPAELPRRSRFAGDRRRGRVAAADCRSLGGRSGGGAAPLTRRRPRRGRGASRRAPAEAARLRRSRRLSHREGAAEALETARAAFGADPASARARWVMRRMLARAGRWEELAGVYAQAIAAPSAAASPRGRADLLIERGRLLEDWLGRASEAVEAYRAALAAVPDHVGALLALLVVGARQQEATVRAEALGGLARRAGGDRRGAGRW